ncbi:hypothetical protein PspS49_19345 [Pseudomonas sp. S49]|nr:hypothetical protein PspS49_19345 [Pseudomonas sp. S49]
MSARTKCARPWRRSAKCCAKWKSSKSELPRSLWERACSRKRSHIQHRCRLTPRLREQARSHIFELHFNSGI